MLAIITIMLVVLAALNAIFTTWATVTDARRAAALMRALGARAGQVGSGLVVMQVLSALPGAIIGIPLGFVLFHAAVHGGTQAPAGWAAAGALGTLLAVAVLTLVPARVAARLPLTQILQSEAG
jgi:putative ABC transport system permease protein